MHVDQRSLFFKLNRYEIFFFQRSKPQPMGMPLPQDKDYKMKRTKSPVKIFMIASILALLMLAAPAAHAVSKGQTVYVPVYSHIYSGNLEKPFDLAVTLSIRNTDPHTTITITRVDYYDSYGKFLTRYLQIPITLAPMAATRYIIKESDKAGGSGANFIVTWEAHSPISPALIESIMISTRAQQGISFTSRGQVISER